MLKKLSLAALVAMGSMSLASATPLTEAIKNVDLNGMLRIRFYHENPESGNDSTRWRTNAVFIFKVPVAENMKFVFRNSTQTYLKHTESNSNDLSGQVDSTMVNNLLFLTYANSGLNVIAGKIPVATPITSVDPASPSHGAGAIATYNVGNGLTLAGAFVTAMKNVGVPLVAASKANQPKLNTDSNGDLITNYNYVGQAINNDTFALAGIYGNDSVKAQLWYFHVENLLKYDVVASADLDLFKLANVQNDFDLQFHVDYATSKLDDAVLDGAKTKSFWNVNVTGKVAGAALRAGYAKSNDEAGVIDLSVDSPLAGNQAKVANYYDIANERDTDMFYADVTYNFTSAIKGTLAYANVDTTEDTNRNALNTIKSDLNEYTVKVDYAYNKKLSFQAYYDYVDFDKKDSDNSEIRVQALYKF